LFLLLLAGGIASGQGTAAPLDGVVLDSSRHPIAGATVRLEGENASAPATSDASGRFQLELSESLAAAARSIRVEAKGYAPRVVTVPAGGAGPLEIVLPPAAFSEKVAVIGSRRPERLSETPESVVSLSSEELALGAAPALDQTLREVPGFTLFRRNDSRTANPTTQGASLRGVGGSGASRAAVLDDGIPLNDPFGGWVSWGRVPLAALDRVEVLRGGGSSLYGGPALSGAVALFRREPESSWAAGEASYGSRDTPQFTAALAGRSGPWSARAAGETFRTDGYVAVPPEERGPVDTAFSSRHDSVDVTLERGDSASSRVFLRGSYFDESRGNGTPLQVNDTDIRQLAAGADFAALAGALSLRAYGMRERYHQTFSAVSGDRKTETLNRLQSVPSDTWGVLAQWSADLLSNHVVAGLEGRDVSGSSNEQGIAGNAVTITSVHGRQQTGALFAEDTIPLSTAVSLTGGVRFDAWRNFDARRQTGPASGPLTTVGLAERSEKAFSPKLALLYAAGGGWTLSASAYKSFRAPTLNELYRTFRVGNTITQANENLDAERLTGGEAAALYSFDNGRGTARASFFWMEVSDPIANVTLSTTPSLITRRRQNLGRTRSRGVEAEAGFFPVDFLEVTVAYLHTDAVVASNPANLALEGLRVAQVPANQGSVRLSWRPSPGWIATAMVRAADNQFEDDENTLPLGPMAVLDALAEAPLLRGLSVFLAGENLLDRRYTIARTPVTNLGAPRVVRGGFRLRLP